MLTRRLSDERGSALVTALLVMFVLVAFSMTVASLVDTDQADSRRERERESSFNVTEGALNAQIYQLSTRWPSATTADRLPDLVHGVLDRGRLPERRRHAEQLHRGRPRWRHRVGDAGPRQRRRLAELLERRPAGVPADLRPQRRQLPLGARLGRRPRPSAGARRARGGGERRAELPPRGARLGPLRDLQQRQQGDHRHERHGEPVQPRRHHRALRAGRSELRGLRRRQGPDPPNTVQSNRRRSPRAVSVEALDQLRERARSDGNYYAGCAPSLAGDQPGEMVFMENANGCQYNGNTVYNTAAKPGYWSSPAARSPRSTAPPTFYGIIYHANLDNVDRPTLINADAATSRSSGRS